MITGRRAPLAAALGAACNANNQVATSTTGNPGGTAGNGGTGNTGNGVGAFDPVGGSQTGSGGDCDNDGSAEILYVSNYDQGAAGPTLTVLRDAEERWIPTRRIWNQYCYHVTSVREDGILPKNMKKSWQLLNTFRTNSQISASGVDCNPEEPPK